jgi:ABC-2 type transport system permease protein
MTATTVDTVDTQVARKARPVPARIPTSRILAVELRKSFDTRSGFWLMASIAILSIVATGATIAFAPDSELDYEAFATAIGFPMAVILPIIAALSVTSEWSQRSGLTTFTLIPHRGRVIFAKAVVSVFVGVVSVMLAFAVGVLGNLVGSAIAGVDTVWDMSFLDMVLIVLGNVLGLLSGFMLGVLIRSSAGAIVTYFVYTFVLPTLSALLAASQHWFRDLQPWVDFNFAQTPLFNGALTSQEWAQLGVTSLVWLVLPTVLGTWLVMRAEVK